MREIKIAKNDAGQRLDKFLTKALDLPVGLLYKSIRTKKIKVNRKRAENNTVLAEGDTIQCFLAEEFFGKLDNADEVSLSFDKIQPKLDIVYEDENIILLNKRPGVSVHEDEDSKVNTLIAHVQAYLYQKGEYNPKDEQSFAPALCNRIDRNTGGIVIAAKTAEALRVMNEKILRLVAIARETRGASNARNPHLGEPRLDERLGDVPLLDTQLAFVRDTFVGAGGTGGVVASAVGTVRRFLYEFLHPPHGVGGGNLDYFDLGNVSENRPGDENHKPKGSPDTEAEISY